MSIISQKIEENQECSNRISNFFSQYNIGKLLLKCGAGKEKILENHSISRLLKNAKKLNTCTFCGGNFATEEDLKNHITSCSGAKYACKFCDFCEVDMEKFWQHMINKHKSDVVKVLDENNN